MQNDSSAAVCYPRKPQQSPLWKLLNDHYYDFELNYDEHCVRKYGALLRVTMMTDQSQKAAVIQRQTLKLFAISFTLLIVFFSSFLIIVYYNLKSSAVVRIEFKEQELVNSLKLITDESIDSIRSDLKYLAEQLQFFVNRQNQTGEPFNKQLEASYLQFSGAKKRYDQIRFLDHTGMETIRINYNDGTPVVVPKAQLQNKATRYYFDNTFKLKQGQLFVSPMDLNIEQGEIERPIKPMIRIGMPVFDRSGNKLGIVLLNFFGQFFIDKIKALSTQSDGVILFVNGDGYFFGLGHPTHVTLISNTVAFC